MILKALKKSFLISLFFLLTIIGLCVFVDFINEDIFDGILVIYTAGFIAIFFGIYISKIKIQLTVGILTSVFTTYFLIQLCDFLFFDYLFFEGKILNHGIKNLSIFSIFLNILSYLYGFFEKTNHIKSIKVLKFPYIQSLLFCTSIIIVYAIIFGFGFSGSFIDNVFFFYRILFIPFLVLYLVSIFLFNYVYKSFENRKWIILTFYISVFVIFFLSCFINYSGSSGAMNIQNFLTYLIVRVPFAYMIILCVQISYLLEINKQEKTILTQQSLESQLNYQQLKNQLSPHFLFNNINVLTSLIEENPNKAVLFSENLSHIYRYFLEQEKQDVVLVKDEIGFAKSYLELLQDRFEVGLNFSILIDENVNEKYIVSTILQQVLENVVKHNEISENKLVEIKIFTENNHLIVENNKNPKLSKEENSKKGIENIKNRIAFFTDEKVIIKNTDELYRIELPILETI